MGSVTKGNGKPAAKEECIVRPLSPASKLNQARAFEAYCVDSSCWRSHTLAASSPHSTVENFYDGIIGQDRFERSGVFQDDSIYYVNCLAGSNLDEAKLLRIVVKAIGLSIQSYGWLSDHLLDSYIKWCMRTDDFDGKL